MMAGGSCEPLKWHVSQIKGGNTGDAKDAEGFTCVEFDDSGEYLAAGDKAGRIFVFNASGQKNPVYNIFCAFTSHEPEFDYLKSLEIEEKINAICWLPPVNNSLHLLSTNDKVIKMWRMSEQTPSAYNFNFRVDDLESESSGESDNLSGASITGKVMEPDDATRHGNIKDVTRVCENHQIKKPSAASLRIPRYRKAKNLTIEVRPRKVYANAHTYHINAISVNSDQETFLSADDLRINLWHLDISNRSFTIVDLKPENMEELSEVITCSRFHPELCNMFGYSTSRGVVRLCDMRVRALCDNYVLVLDDPALSQNRGFFGDIISSLSDFRFDHSGNYILARDYLSLKIWDIRKGDQPCEAYSVHEPLRSQLCMLYETDAIFDKFLCSWSDDDRYVFTGSYGNVLRIFDRIEGVDWAYDLGEPGVRPALSSLAATNAVPQQGNIPPSLSLRPYRVRLQPKRFIAPDSELGDRFRIQAVCLAHAASIDALASPNNAPTTSVPVPAGSKRRKQILLPSLPIARREDDEEDEGEDVDDSDASDEDGGFRVADINGRPSSGTGLTGLRELDYKRKFLQVAWHPQRRVIASVCANEVFICLGKEAGPQIFPQTDEEGDLEGGEGTEKAEAALLIGSPLDIKAAKRRKRRQRFSDQTASSTMSGFTESAAPATSHLTAVVDGVEGRESGKDSVTTDTSSGSSKMEF